MRRGEGRKFWFAIAGCALVAIGSAYRLIAGILSGSLEAPLKNSRWAATFADEPAMFVLFALVYALIAAGFGFLTIFFVRDRRSPQRSHDPAPTIPTNFSNR